MKQLSQLMQETLKNESLKKVFSEKLVDEELDALTRVAPVKAHRKSTKSLVDTAIGGTS